MNHCWSALIFSNNILCDNFYRRCTSGESFQLPIIAKAEINNAHAKWLACGNVFCLYTERWGCCAMKTVHISSKRLPRSVYNKITIFTPPLPTLDCFSSLTVPPTPATIWPPTFCHHRGPKKKVRTGDPVIECMSDMLKAIGQHVCILWLILSSCNSSHNWLLFLPMICLPFLPVFLCWDHTLFYLTCRCYLHILG